MNKNILTTLGSVAALSVVSGVSSATALDFSGVTAAVDVTTLLAAITAVAALKVAPGVARWGYGKLISWFN